MSDDVLDCVRRAYAAYSVGDFATLLELFHPQVEVMVAPPNFEAGLYVGHGEYLGLIQRWAGAWEEMRTQPRETEVAGEWALVNLDYFGRGKDSDVEVTQPSWEASRWVDGTCRRYEVYWDRDDGEAAFARCREAQQVFGSDT